MFLLADLGVTRSHNRPHTSNDNPFSESHFKTLKYQPPNALAVLRTLKLSADAFLTGTTKTITIPGSA